MKTDRVIQVGNIMDDTNKSFKNPQCGRIYSENGIAPTINTCGGGDREQKIITFMEEAKVINPLKGKTDESWFFEQQVYDENGIARAIKSTDGSGNVPKVVTYMEEKTSIIQLPHGYKGLSEYENVCPTITTSSFEHNNFVKTEENMEEEKSKFHLPKELDGKKFRVRKLTEREVFRLMDVDDADIDKIKSSGISRSAQYKCAGNSICVGVLYHLFRKLLIEPENESQQLSLF